jgi:hypothetical protein
MAQYDAGFLEDYTRMSKDATSIRSSPTILATALALEKIHGTRLAAAYLHDAGIAADVVVELLYGSAIARSRESTAATVHWKQRKHPTD